MAGERTLFERIADPEKKPPRSARERKEVLVKSIIHHLQRLLNSRQGCCQILDDYGMPDMESRAGSRIELQHELEAALRSTVAKYEPRLRKISVRMDPSEEERLVPKFTIVAELAPRDDFAKDVSFMTVVDPSGKILID